MDLTGINNINEYYSNHYLSSIFEENAADTINAWKAFAKEKEDLRTPWALLRDCARQYYAAHDKLLRSRIDGQVYLTIRDMANLYLDALGYAKATPFAINVEEGLHAPVYLEIKKANGAPLLWVLLSCNSGEDTGIMQSSCFHAEEMGDGDDDISETTAENEELATKIFFSRTEPPRWLVFIGFSQIALVDRNKWNEKRYLEFDLDEIFGRREESTLQAMSVLLHRESLCPDEGESLLDKLDESSHKHASGVSNDLKYALRESIELLGNEVLYDMAHRLGRDLNSNPVDASELSIECLRYMYRMLFVLFIEARPELGYAPMKAQAYVQGYSLESLREVAESINEETAQIGEGYFLHETLSKLYDLIYNGYPSTEEELKKIKQSESIHDIFIVEPLKAHIFDPEFTPLLTNAKLRNCVMLRIIDLMSVTRSTGRRYQRRGRISYATLGINQMGAVYEALLSYRGFIAEQTLYEVCRAQDRANLTDLDVGYFIPESELGNYSEDERVREKRNDPSSKLRKYEKGTFIYRLAGREREKSASYYTPEVLTKCLVKYALKELLEGKSADEILHLTICEPAMGSAAFLNEAINQLAEAYLNKKQKELGALISYNERWNELQHVKMYIADRNVYGIDLNPIAVELAEVSLWLNTISKGGFVPWFSTQLVCGNSLIGARRQCYSVAQLQADRAPGIWYTNEPERVMPGSKRKPKTQVYHFLTGDPGMSSYTDKVIKDLEPDNIKFIKDWNKKFTKSFDDDEVTTLLRLSSTIDELWEKQVQLRREIEEKTSDPLTVYGQKAETFDSHTTIREKDLIYKRIYKSEEQKNAGPYARLKFAMDYWCALWFWPIDKAELLPTRSEFLFDMSMILEGTIEAVNITSGKRLNGNAVQTSMFPTEIEQMAIDLLGLYDKSVVDIPALCEHNPRLKLAKAIAKQQRFMHWELEFADLFKERGGFDLILGNPPWIKMTWNENDVLSDSHPMFAVKDLTAMQTAHKRGVALHNTMTKAVYFSEYEIMSGTQSFLNGIQNYAALKGQQTNLYKCFLPQAWMFCSKAGVSAFVHPDGVYDDPQGGIFREVIYSRLKKHFQFRNELKLFQDVHHSRIYGINIYKSTSVFEFESISNLFHPATIDECYNIQKDNVVLGIKNNEGEWNTHGHPNRILFIGKKELLSFAQLYDGDSNWKQARLPALQTRDLLLVLQCFASKNDYYEDLGNDIFGTTMWHETNAQKDGTIIRNIQFPDRIDNAILSGAHIGVANPFFKSSRRICEKNSDYDYVDLSALPMEYVQRCNYSINCLMDEYIDRVPITPWGQKYNAAYRAITRSMLDPVGYRTLIATIIPPNCSHIISILGLAFKDTHHLCLFNASLCSLPFDYLIKSSGRGAFLFESAKRLPIIIDPFYEKAIQRTLMLNCLTSSYEKLWVEEFNDSFPFEEWSKIDPRLKKERFSKLTSKWSTHIPLRTDFERRQALVEIDVITALVIGMTLEQLIAIYRLQFSTLQSQESDTWYDTNGRIVFTNNRSLTRVGFSRAEFEIIKNAPAGEKFYRNIIDDTMPGGPIERTIEYVAPFDRCDREQDYDTAWKFFEEKYGKK